MKPSLKVAKPDPVLTPGLLLTLGLILAPLLQALAFEVDEFKSGQTKQQVKALLANWKFDAIEDLSGDTTIASDKLEKGTNRLFKFFFCSDKLVGFEQAMKPSAKNFITVAGNYINTYGQPARVAAGSNVISTGEKNSVSMSWRAKNDFVGVRYLINPNGEDLFVIYETPNNCWQVPRR
jgi:hypothetical protein